MIPLFGDSMAGGKRWVLEGRLISVALQALRLGTSVVLDYGLWGRDERSALRWLARSAGAACQVIYLPVDKIAASRGRPANGPRPVFKAAAAEADVTQAARCRAGPGAAPGRFRVNGRHPRHTGTLRDAPIAVFGGETTARSA